MGIVPALIITVLIGLAVGAAQGILSSPLGLSPIVVTLGFFTGVRGVVFVVTEGRTASGFGDTFAIIGRGRVRWLGGVVVVGRAAPGCRWGLAVRVVGENPQAADVSGIDVNKRRRQGVYLSGITSGLGGGYLLLGQVGLFEEQIVGGRGFIAIAALIFGGWTLRGAVAGCLLFGAVDSFRLSLPTVGYEVTAEVLQALPFVVTIATVAVFAHRTRQPAALAQPFVRGLT